MLYFYIWLALFVMLIVWLVNLPKELWKDYLAVMNLMRVRDLAEAKKGQPIAKWAYRLGRYILFRAYIKDFIVNTVHVSAILREWPRWSKWSRRSQYSTFIKWLLKDGEYTVSQRLQRHIDTPTSERRELCLFLQTYWLSPYDTSGKHGTATALARGDEFDSGFVDVQPKGQ